jgi:hypothetical protein
MRGHPIIGKNVYGKASYVVDSGLLFVAKVLIVSIKF